MDESVSPDPGAPWVDEQTRQHLQVLVEGVAGLAGFEQSAITLLRGDAFEVVVAAGIPDGFTGTRVPVATIEAELANADEWGVWRFVPHDRIGDERAGVQPRPGPRPPRGS